MRALAAKEGWDPAAEVRIADLDGKTARVGVSQRYEFHVRVGRRAMIVRFYDEAVSWRRADGAVVESGSDFVAGDGVAGLMPAVRALELVGPLDLRVDGGGGDADLISLHLPTVSYLPLLLFSLHLFVFWTQFIRIRLFTFIFLVPDLTCV